MRYFKRLWAAILGRENVLQSGPFLCTEDFAVECAHMLGSLEGALHDEEMDIRSACEKLILYLSGTKSAEAVIAEVEEIYERITP